MSTKRSPGSARETSFLSERPRWGVVTTVALLHFVLVIGLIRAFAPDMTMTITGKALQAFTLTPSRRPTARPLPQQHSYSSPEGNAGGAGQHALPRAVAAPLAPIIALPTQAPVVTGQGLANEAGAAVRGAATGASGIGSGNGGGAAGAGPGAGGTGRGIGGMPTVKIAGDINSAKDYPRKSREQRIGAAVTIDLAIDITGRVSHCTVVHPSPDPAADAITCDLATRRFRFRPAQDASGVAVPSVFRWRQQWYY